MDWNLKEKIGGLFNGFGTNKGASSDSEIGSGYNPENDIAAGASVYVAPLDYAETDVSEGDQPKSRPIDRADGDSGPYIGL